MDKNIYRTHSCGELKLKDIDSEVVLSGWVESVRDHGGVLFLDLRDMYGVTQCVSNDDSMFTHIPKESVVTIHGVVRKRSEDTYNDRIPTGEVEVLASSLDVITLAKPELPFEIMSSKNVDENLRLKYRYLDLRRPEMQRNLMLRHRVTKVMRDFLDKQGFVEIETPMLTKSTPEGARDYLVPSRSNPGKFFALPQSPQIFKQILMVAGYEKYFQIVRCFRDEDLRADRQPEFTQLDIEMSFIDDEDILGMMEDMTVQMFKEGIDADIKAPFKRLTYAEAMDKYGSDKPDLRFEMELVNLSEAVKGSDFKVFESVIQSGGEVKAINVKNYANIARRELDGLVDYVGIYGAKGLAWIQYTEEGIKSPITKFFSEEIINNITATTKAETGDLILIIADKPAVVAQSLGELRLEMARRLNLIDEDKLSFLWVVDFPMFEYNEDDKRWVAMHHPFTAPCDEDIQYLDTDPGKIKAKAYDLV